MLNCNMSMSHITTAILYAAENDLSSLHVRRSNSSQSFQQSPIAKIYPWQVYLLKTSGRKIVKIFASFIAIVPYSK